ncbi:MULTISPECIES: XkdF-like putative serine protease domain-containing protein [Exiguobacterium]|uniref:XkdF-like putative serine protease domain-containing protein n=1 Tax=Exiguobacterium TaxID=33986 RepID=UPI001AE21EEF|nr:MULTISPECIES: XkdF-like putative serine protease domain-containing protein [Exiguobacterium]MCT4779832.1 XkdF-like putative serine protease domain-containing protein [Exiguobacterium soli]
MPREIKNLVVSHVSIVDKAANKRSFLLTKSEEQPNVSRDMNILKQDESQQIAYGIVYEPLIKDAHDDYMTADEIEKAAHIFLKDYRQIDKQHDFTSQVGDVIESYIAPADFELGGETVTKGTWVMAVKVADEVWTGIQKGEYTGFSLAGMGEVIEKAEDHKSFLAKVKDSVAEVLKDMGLLPDEQGEEVTDMTQEQLQKELDSFKSEMMDFLKSALPVAKAEEPEQAAAPEGGQPEEPDAQQADPEASELEKAQAKIAELEKQLSVRQLPGSHTEIEKAEPTLQAEYTKYFGPRG